MMLVAISLATIGIFVAALSASGILRVAVNAMVITKRALAIIRDDNTDDEEREQVSRRASVQLLGTTFSIVVRSVLVAIISFLPVLLADWTGLAKTEDVFLFLSRCVHNISNLSDKNRFS